MRLWDRLLHGRSKDKQKDYFNRHSYDHAANSLKPGRDLTAKLTPALLDTIFRYVCPHASDESFAANENAPLEDRCFLCDTRNLAECSRVRRAWRAPAYNVLYRSVRLDVCHYCYLEDELTERRQKKKKVEDPTAARLRLFADTVRGNPDVGAVVHFFKLPILTRQNPACYSDLARAVGAMPNIEYVDLPDNLFRGDQSCDILWIEIQQNCKNLARMQFYPGSELKFRNMHGQMWSRLRVLELQGLRLDVQTMRMGLSNLTSLEELTLSDITTMNDQLFFQSPALPVDFPVLRILSIEKCPNITSRGLSAYLERPEVRHNFVNLSLSHTGVAIEDLHIVLQAATNLETMSIVEEVSSSMPLQPIPPMRSASLNSLHFEVLSRENSSGYADIDYSESYYMYLSSSLTAHALPNLRNLYVRYPMFVDLLVMPPPAMNFVEKGSKPPIPTNPFGLLSELSIYTKGQDNDSWYSSVISPGPSHQGASLGMGSPSSGRAKSTMSPSSLGSNGIAGMGSPGMDSLPLPPPLFGGHGEPGNRSSVVSLSGMPGQRALSVYGTSRPIGPQWGGEAVKSIVVANPDAAGFQVLPQDNAEPAGAGDWDVNRMSFLSAPGNGIGGPGLMPSSSPGDFLRPAEAGHRRHHSHYQQGPAGSGLGIPPPPRKKKSAIDLWR